MQGTPASGAPTVVGLVLTLAAAKTDLSPLLTGLRDRPGLRLGEQSGHWLPVTAETDDPRELHRWLEVLPGVCAVDVVFVEVALQTPEASSDSGFVVPPSGGIPAPPEGGTTNRNHGTTPGHLPRFLP